MQQRNGSARSLRAFTAYERNGEHVDRIMSGCRDGRQGGGPTLRSMVREMRCFIIFFLRDNCFTEFCCLLSNLNMSQP